MAAAFFIVGLTDSAAAPSWLLCAHEPAEERHEQDPAPYPRGRPRGRAKGTARRTRTSTAPASWPLLDATNAVAQALPVLAKLVSRGDATNNAPRGSLRALEV